MNTHFVSFRKAQWPRTIRIEFVITARTAQEARTIAEKEAAALKGYTYLGTD